MDELIFRGSQKLENLQIQFSLAAQQGKILFQQYSQRGAILANQLWDSPKMQQIQDLTKELLLWVLEVLDRGKETFLNVVDPRNFFLQVTRLLRNNANRRQLLFGCIGFIIGSFVGYSVAQFIQKPVVFSAHMQAAVCANYNGIDCASLIEDAPVPRVEECDDILIQVQASSISLVDVAICHGYANRLRKLLNKSKYSSKSEFPIVLGRSCSGVVIEIGSSVTRFDIGDEVFVAAPFWATGTTSEVYLAKDYQANHKPKRIGFEAAAGLPYFGSIALNAVSSAGITKNNANGKRVLICNAYTAVGCILVQYCKYLGVEITATTNMKTAPVAEALGANEIIIIQENMTKTELETDSPNLLKKELELRDLFDVIFVTKEIDLSIEQLQMFCKSNGKVVSTLLKYFPSDNFGFILGSFFWVYIRTKGLIRRLFNINSSNYGEPSINRNHLEILADLVDNYQLQSVVDKVFHPHDIELALEHVQSSNSVGSCVITFR